MERHLIGHIHSVESMGLVDGPGVRAVVFLQGCPLRCLYCHNPDTQGAGGTETDSAQLVDRLWTDGAAYVDENALSVTVKRLRDKLEETPSRPRFIKTVYGLGYTWAVN